MQLSNQKHGVGNRIMMLAAFGAMLAISTALPGTPANAASNLMELFQKKREQRQTIQPRKNEAQPVIKPVIKSVISPVSAPVSIAPVKRITVKGPQIYDYKADPLVRVDFSKLDFQATAATNEAALPVKLVSYDTTTEHLKSVDVWAEKAIAAAIVEFYSTYQKPIWSSDDAVTVKAKNLVALFSDAKKDGLDPQDYAVAVPAESSPTSSRSERLQALADFEIELSARAIRYAMDAGEGRIVANRLSGFHDLPRGRIDPREVLERLGQLDDPAAYLQNLHPQNKFYASLKAELAKLETQHDSGIRIAADTLIRPGESSDQIHNIVALILKQAPEDYLEKHRGVLQAHSAASLYDPELVSAIKDYQAQTGSTPDGVIGRNTVAALQGEQVSVKRDRIIYAMERLRWLPHDFGERYVFVNQPAYRAQFMEAGAEKLAMNIVVGSRTNQTYFFYNKVQTVVFNPSWGVPRSIILNEMLPKIMRDSSYLARNGYEVYVGGKPVPASSVNWTSVAAGNSHVGIRQKPSLDNSLGELKIMFPNSHDIYMHDTPAKSYFKRDMRALSHGCIRLERPRDMAAAVLGKTVDDLGQYFGKNERGIKVADPMPVYIAYFTAWPDATGRNIEFFDDIYDRDVGLEKAFAKTHISRSL